MPAQLPPELNDLRERLRRFLNEELLPLEQQEGTTDEEEVGAELRRRVRMLSEERGFFSLTVPTEFGGQGIGVLGLTVIREEIAVSGSILGGYMLGRSPGILRLCQGEQRERYLLPVIRGEKTQAFGFTEPQEGVPGGGRTVARRDGDSWVINGLKSYVSGGDKADFTVVVVNVTDDGQGRSGTGLLAVERDAPGLTFGKIKTSMDGTTHTELYMKDCRVPAMALLGEVGQGLPRAMDNISATRLAISAGAVGTARRVLALAVNHVKQPHKTGVSLGDREQIQAMIADMAADTYTTRATLYETAMAAEAGQDVFVETAITKMVCTEGVGRVVDRAMQIFGGNAYVKGHPIERLYRVVRAWRIAEGTTEVLRLNTARGLLARKAMEW
ncbi:MAG: acyl-CoA/acyl-ACP dehydrogenase [Chloroflexi bacterium]|nr:acyl-CoA/acyl-ACP dehydrogenase [Chloroflexota bacterium]